jgi:parallel beta-helix repeat protein
MANVKISELPQAYSIGVDDVVTVVQAGVTKKAPYSLFAGSGGSTSTTDGFVILNADKTGATAAQNQILAAAQTAAAAGVPLIVPAGNYLITDAPILPKGLTMRCAPTARFFGNRPAGNIVWLQDNTTVEGGIFENTSTDACFDVWIAGNGNTKLIGATLKGAAANGLFFNYPGLDNVLIDNCLFDGLVYGVLLNPGANDAKNITFQRNRFRNIAADAIEINAATGGGSNRVKGLKIINNPEIRVDTNATGDSAGFGIGLAGCVDFTITGNTILKCRNEGIHIEDGSSRGVISGNTIFEGTNNTRSAIIIYQGCSDIAVSNNVIRNFTGKGITVVYDSNGASKNIKIDNNLIVSAGQAGIQVGGEAGQGPYHVNSNTIINPAGNGIEVFGAHELCVLDGTVITGAGAAGVATAGAGSGARAYRNTIVAPTTVAYAGGVVEGAFTNGGGAAGSSGTTPGTGGGTTTPPASTTGTGTGATHDPVTITGMTGRWRAGSITGVTDGSKVTSWPDSSGNNYPALQGTADLAPVYVASSTNSKPGVRWPASGTTFMTTQSPAGQSTQTIVAIIKPTTAAVTAGTTIAVRGEDDIAGLELRFVGGVAGNLSQNQVDLGSATTAIAGNAASIVVTTYSGSTGSMWKINGTTRGISSATATLNTLRKTWIGANGAQTGEFFQGDILELITFSRVLTSQEIIQIDSYAQEWYGITVADFTA